MPEQNPSQRTQGKGMGREKFLRMWAGAKHLEAVPGMPEAPGSISE